MKKIIISGLVAGLAMLVVGAMLGFLSGAVFPSLRTAYSNAALFRSFTDTIFISVFVIQPFIAGLLLSWLWSKTNSILKGKDPYRKGISFGLVYWVIMLLGLMLGYASSPIPLLMIASWSVSLLAQALCAGLIYAKMNK